MARRSDAQQRGVATGGSGERAASSRFGFASADRIRSANAICPAEFAAHFLADLPHCGQCGRCAGFDARDVYQSVTAEIAIKGFGEGGALALADSGEYRHRPLTPE